MKATNIAKGVDAQGVEFDHLVDFLSTKEGKELLEKMDAGWLEVMRAAEKCGFVSQAYGGVATLATHAAVEEQLGLQAVADRLRMCNVDIPINNA